MRNSLLTLLMVVTLMAFMSLPALAQNGEAEAVSENMIAVPAETVAEEAVEEAVDEVVEEAVEEDAGESVAAEETQETTEPAEDEKELVTTHALLHGVRIEIVVPDGMVDIFRRNREVQLTMNSFLPHSDSFIALFVQKDRVVDAFASRTFEALPGLKYGVIGPRDRQDAGLDEWGAEKILNEAENEFRETVDDERARIKRTTHYVILTQPFTFNSEDGTDYVTATAHLPLRERKLRLTVTVPFENDGSIVDAQERAGAWADDMIRANAETPEESVKRKSETATEMQKATQGMRYFVQIVFVGFLLLVGYRQGRDGDGKPARAVLLAVILSILCTLAASQYLVSPAASGNIDELGLTPMPFAMMMVMSLWLIAMPVAWFVQVCYMLATQKKYPFGKSYYRTLCVLLTAWTLMYAFGANVTPPA